MRIGIIGGSGLDNPDILKNSSKKEIKTKFGSPSSPLISGNIEGIDVVILVRHGKSHHITPSEVNYRANIYALKQKKCDYILATTAVGSLRAEIKPGNLVFPNQFIDHTRHRKSTFFDKKVVHTPMSEPFNKALRDILCQTAEKLGLNYNRDVTVITIEGPRFSTRAESKMFRLWGADIINMSTCPEVILANELKIPYQSIAMSTDYDCWMENTEALSFELVMRRMEENAKKVKRLLLEAIPKLK